MLANRFSWTSDRSTSRAQSVFQFADILCQDLRLGDDLGDALTGDPGKLCKDRFSDAALFGQGYCVVLLGLDLGDLFQQRCALVTELLYHPSELGLQESETPFHRRQPGLIGATKLGIVKQLGKTGITFGGMHQVSGVCLSI